MPQKQTKERQFALKAKTQLAIALDALREAKSYAAEIPNTQAYSILHGSVWCAEDTIDRLLRILCEEYKFSRSA